MKLAVLFFSAIFSLTTMGTFAQCLNGGCEIGLSRANSEEGIFIGHFDGGKKQGLGINYSAGNQEKTTSYANYFLGEKDGVEYQLTTGSPSQDIIHTFTSYNEGVKLYPAFRIIKNGKKTSMQVDFSEEGEWEKYEAKLAKGEMQMQSVIHHGSPAFIAINGKDVLMVVSATIGHLELFSSAPSDVYFNPMQIVYEDDRLNISLFPKNGADETFFRMDTDWDVNKPEDGLWLYKRYFNQALSYKSTYEDVLQLPTQKEIREQKLEKAFDFVATQVDEYDFVKGHPDKAKDFIDILKDIEARAERKGLDVSSTYDITMTKLYLQMGNKEKALLYAQGACEKSPGSYDIINEMITIKYSQHLDLLTNINKDGFEEGSTEVTSKM